MVLSGPSEGFQVSHILYDPKYDLQGYAGVLPSTKTAYIVFRGSSSIMNWLDDFEVKKIPYDTYPECDCKVHDGFYKTTLNLKNQAIIAVQEIEKKYKFTRIIVTGHSLGAAVAQLIGMELEREHYPVTIYNFGQPRTGDIVYAKFVNTIISNVWRFTHDKDMVPHVPPITELNYYHSCREVFEDASGGLRECSKTNGEDPTCTDQYSLIHTSVSDHNTYLKHPVDCGTSVH
jgi:predicted lipase